jgi:hypothetical protein
MTSGDVSRHVFCDMQHEIPAFTRILQELDIDILTRFDQLKGVTIEVAYIDYSDKIITQFQNVNIRKIFVISNITDTVVVPKDFVKFSSNATSNGQVIVVLNHKDYITECEIVLNGAVHVNRDMQHMISALYGNTIVNDLINYNLAPIENAIKSRQLPNPNNLYIHVYITLEGLHKCDIRKKVILLQSDVLMVNMEKIMSFVSNSDKLITLDKPSTPLGINDTTIAGMHEVLLKMFTNVAQILNNKVIDLRRKLRLEYTPDQIIMMGYMMDKIDYIAARQIEYQRKIVDKWVVYIN